MTVRSEIERAKAIAEAAKGNYLLFSEQTEDRKAREVFQEMAEDMERHSAILTSRLDYLEERYGAKKGERGRREKDEKEEKGEKI